MRYLSSLRAEIFSFSKRSRLFLFFSMLVIFCIGAEYGVTRPATQSLFLSVFSAKALPWIWISTVPLNLFVIYLYNRFLPSMGPLKMLILIGSAVIGINTLCAFLFPYLPQIVFIQYAWKDIYILLMFKQIWSMILATLPSARAKVFYGFIYSMGTLGGVFGNMIPGFFAMTLGSEKLLYLTLPIYSLLIFFYQRSFRLSQMAQDSFKEELAANPRPSEGFSLIRRSPFLFAILLLVICMQASVGLVEFQFNAHLERFILDPDLRTEFCGKLAAMTNLLGAGLQLVGGFFIIQFLGIKRSHFFIPLVLLLNAIAFFIWPSFLLISASLVFIKAMDYSLFGIVRELLYIPLKLDEKFRAKAVIDVFAYRSSKAFISLSILFFQIFAGALILPLASLASMAVFLGWIGVVFFMVRKSAKEFNILEETPIH